METIQNLGIIGYGEMGEALTRGILGGGTLDADHYFAYDRQYEKVEKGSEELGFTPCHDEKELASHADTLLIAVLPTAVESVLAPIESSLPDKLIISIAGGVLFDDYEAFLPDGVEHITMIPNVCAEVGEGTFLLEKKHNLSDAHYADVLTLLSSMGKTVEIDSQNFGVGTTIASCSPAYFAVAVEAMADGAVELGFPRQQAYEVIAQAMKGTASLILDSDNTPSAVKDAVTSPGGSTIKGVNALEENGMRNAFIKAVKASSGK